MGSVVLAVAVLTSPFWLPSALGLLAFCVGAVLGVVGSALEPRPRIKK